MDNQMLITFGQGKRIAASYGGFGIETDQSPKNGGDGSAPEPFDLFLASLGTCAGAYVQGFCQKRDISTQGVQIKQTWERNDQGKIVRIALTIEVPSDFPAKYRDAVVRAASQCAVKKTIESPPDFVVETAVHADA